MDAQRFDNLARVLGRASSRRRVLKELAGGLVASLAGVRREDGKAARPPRQPNGAACTRATDCASFICADGVCCDEACTGQCEACHLPNEVGVCTPVSGEPVGLRAACPGTGPCQATCDGVTRARCAGTPPTGASCGPPTCGDGWLTTHACGANGSCVPTTTNCAPFGCDAGSAACATGCTGDAQCGAGSACVGGQCLSAKPIGGSCTVPGECQSGVCAQGVCCVEPCEGQCVSCAVAGALGFCTPTAGVACDDGSLCTTDDVCQNNGDCAGTPKVCPRRGVCESAVCNPATGECQHQPAAPGTVCRAATGPCDVAEACDGSSPECPADEIRPEGFECRPAACVDGAPVLAATCDGASVACPASEPDAPCAADVCSGATELTLTSCEGAGQCVTRVVDCGLYYCADGACGTGCANNDDCVDAGFCDGGVCREDRPNGQACTVSEQCQSGFCVDSVCCNTACDSECANSCSTGTCESQTGSPCGPEGVCQGTCDGAGVCVFPGYDVECDEEQCVDGVETYATGCNGAGVCESFSKGCAPYNCDAAGKFCLNLCADHDECDDGYYCNEGHECVEQKAQSDFCGDARECVSGFCVDGYCCDTACTGQCESCNNFSEGTCRPTTGRPRGGRPQCNGGPVFSVCAGLCDGVNTEACAYPDENTVCGGEGQCVGNTLFAGSFCEGAGFCPDLIPPGRDCAPYRCAHTLPTCRTECTADTQCVTGHSCAQVAGVGRCLPDLAPAAPCDDGDTCAGGLSCQATAGGDRCCPAASCPPCRQYDATCTCVPIPDSDGRSCAADRICCAGECCAAGGACASGACTVACKPVGPSSCSSVSECCLDDGTTACTQVAAADYDDVCCHNLGGTCDPDAFNAREASIECCDQLDPNAPPEYGPTLRLGCGEEAICGGKGTRCSIFGTDLECAFGRCCAATIDGESRFFCCGADEVCRQHDGGCKKALGGPCAADEECDPIAGHICCEGQCVDSRADDDCGACGNACPAGSTCTNGQCNLPNGADCSADGECGSGLCCDVCVPSDERNCGACGDACAPGGQCTDRRCRETYGASCESGEGCLSGICRNNVCCDLCGGECGQLAPDDTPCNTTPHTTNYVCCGGACTYVAFDEYRCGSCSTICTAGDACFVGSCTCTESTTCPFEAGSERHACHSDCMCVTTTEGGLACVEEERSSTNVCENSAECQDGSICTESLSCFGSCHELCSDHRP